MSQQSPDDRPRRTHRAERSSRPWRRRLLLLLGVIGLLGALAWSASAATSLVSGRSSTGVEPAAATPEQTAEVQQTAAALGSWLDLARGLPADQAVSGDLVFGAKEVAAAAYPTVGEALEYADDRVATLAADEETTPEQLDTQLDDLDGDGDPASDYDGGDGVELDFDADVDSRSGSRYELDVEAKLTVAEDSPLAMRLDGMRVNGEASGKLTVTFRSTIRVDLSATGARRVAVPVTDAGLGSVRASIAGTFEGDDALAFNASILGVRGTGGVRAEGGVAVGLRDPNGDGVLDLDELATPLQVLRPSCVSEGVDLDLTVTTDLAGLTGEAGRITLKDPTLCNGLSAPDVQLGDLGQFRHVSLADFVNGLAQVTQALQTAQDAGDLDLPLIREPLRDLIQANERLVAFFVDNGFTRPEDPMAAITVDTAENAPIQTIQDVAPRLAEALGVDLEALGLHFADGRLLLDVTAHPEADEPAERATLDFGDTLTGVGVTEITGSGTATVDPSYAVEMGVGIDLARGLELADRFYLTNGSNGAAVTFDAPITADVHVDAIASALRLQLDDADPEAAVPLLQRRDASKPMLSVSLTDPDRNGRVTLTELSAADALPVRAQVNATVPETVLSATADAVGIPFAAGHVTLSWPDLAVLSGFDVEVDAEFEDSALPFAFDTSNPRKLITDVLEGTHKTVTELRARIADGDVTTTKPLPLVGKSVADLDPVLAKLQGTLDKLIQTNEMLTLPELKDKLVAVVKDALGLDGARAAAAGQKGLDDLVEVSFEKQDGDKRAQVVVDLDLGVCTDDRTEDREGCTFENDPIAVPFNLDLGSGSRVGGIAGLGTEGEVSVSYDARALLTLGVELPKVEMPDELGDLPDVTGTPKLWVQDDSEVDIGVGARLEGTLAAGLGPLQVSLGSGEDRAKAAVAARYTMKLAAPTKQRLVIGSEPFKSWLRAIVPAGGITVHEKDEDLDASCDGVTGPVDACAVLPVYSDGTDLGTVEFAAPDLLSPSTWTIDSSEVEANLQNEAIQFALLVDGVRTLTTQVSEGLRSLPTGTKIPLVGTDVTAGAKVLDDFDQAVLAKVDELSDAVAAAGTAGAVKTKTEEVLVDLPGLEGRAPTVSLTCRPASGTGPAQPCQGAETISRIQSFQVDVSLTYGDTADTGAFDIGFPGLRLASKDKITGAADLVLDLGFGVDRDLGFYVPTDGTEVALEVKANLPHDPEDPDLTGDLAFLPIEIEDAGSTTKPDVLVTAGLDLRTTRSDQRLPLADLGRAELDPTLSAETLLNLDIKTVRSGGASGALPTFGTDLVVDAGISWNGRGAPTRRTNIAFNNVTVDAGSLVSDVIKPAVKTLRTYTGPLEKPIEAIQKPIPGVAEAAKLVGKTPPTWYEAFQVADRAANGPNSTALQLIDRVIKLVALVKKIDGASTPSGQVEIGSFQVAGEAVHEPVPLNQADKLVTGAQVESTDVIDDLGFDTDKGEFSKARSQGGLSFPAFENPKSLFGMLLGKDVPLVYYDAGDLGFQRGFQFSYPLGPARLYIGGSAGVYGHLAAGFDTYGIRKSFEILNDGDPTNNGPWQVTKGLLQGFYLDDFDQSGKDVPEIRFEAKLVAGAAVGIPGIEVGAEGGVRGTVAFNLVADDTGRVRYPQIKQQLDVNPNPLCFFDASAKIDAFVRAYIETFFFTAEYPIASAVIYEQPNLLEGFCKTPQAERENLLADLEDGKLTLKTDDSPETIVMTQLDADTVQLSGKGVQETYEPVTKPIVADFLGGDDVFDVQPVADGSPALPVTVCGGAGNDRVMVGAGLAELYGDGGGTGCVSVPSGGDDTLISADAGDKLFGGGGNDSLDGGGGVDQLVGDGGNDVLRGGFGNDAIQGGSGEDTTDYGDHSAPVTINLPGPSGSEGENDEALSVEHVRGGSGADTINLPTSGTILADGGVGADTMNGAGGAGILMGSDGDDMFVGGTGTVQVIGSGGDDTLVDGSGTETFLGMEGVDTVDYSAATTPLRVALDGEPGDGPEGARTDNIIDTDVVIGSTHADVLIGSAGDEELRGGPGADLLEGGSGNDILLGEAGEDDLHGDGGRDDLDGGVDADRLHGGGAGDDLRGGDGFDWVDYSDRTVDLWITKDDRADDGASRGGEGDNVRIDVERIVGGSGQDRIEGYWGDDTLEGGPGNDVLHGVTQPARPGGSDTFIGGDGADQMYDLTFNRRETDTGPDAVGDEGGADTYVGGDGDDWADGHDGPDTYDMGAGDDDVRGGLDGEVIHGGDGDDELNAEGGDDEVHGDDGDDLLRGDDGDDVMDGGASDEGGGTLWGGLGADELWVADGGGIVYGGTNGNWNDADTSPNVIHGSAGTAGRVSSFYGAKGDDTLLLGSSSDRAHGWEGDDVIDLGDGDNWADGHDGTDTITSGTGADQLTGGTGDDALTSTAGRDNLTGGEGNDTLSSGADDDGLDGGAGDDVLNGGTNADDVYGGTGTDTVTYADRTTPVTLREDGNFAEGGDEDVSSRPQHPTLRDVNRVDVERFVGGQAGDSITVRNRFREEPVVIDGGPGADTLQSLVAVPVTFVGGPGDDRLIGGAGPDVFDQGSAPDGADSMTGGAKTDLVDYRERPAGSVVVTADGLADDGATGERDNVGADIEVAGKPEDPPPPTIGVDPVTVVEGGAGSSTAATFTVRLAAASPVPVPLTWSAGGGTATAGADYEGSGGTVTVPAGSLSATFDLTVLGDAADEPDEVVDVTVAGPANTASAVLTLVDDDAPAPGPGPGPGPGPSPGPGPGPTPAVKPQVHVSSAAAKEGRRGKGTMTFRVTLSQATTVPVTVKVATADQTAKAGKDYVALSRTVTFAPGQTSVAVKVAVKGDQAKEKTEKFRVVLAGVTNAVLGRTGVGTIRNDDR